MLIATTGSGSKNISESEKRWFWVCKKVGTAGSGYYIDLKALLGFMKEATKNLHFSGWVN
jgi:hypothetical protein